VRLSQVAENTPSVQLTNSMALYKYGGAPSDDTSKPVGITEFEILKASHKFLRDEDEKATSWDEQLATKYYTSLYREFAVCDLKHYKSGNFALRWRTEEEVLSGSGETTCGNTRCQRHFASRYPGQDSPLTTLELPFSYSEQGESKSALVKVALCEKCVKKLMWKRHKEKEKGMEEKATAGLDFQTITCDSGARDVIEDPLAKRRKKKSRDTWDRDEIPETETETRRRRSSRSRSPRRAHISDIPSRRPHSIPMKSGD